MWYLPSFIHLANSAALSCVAFCMCMLCWALWRGVGGRGDEGGAGEVGWGGRGGLENSLPEIVVSFVPSTEKDRRIEVNGALTEPIFFFFSFLVLHSFSTVSYTYLHNH